MGLVVFLDEHKNFGRFYNWSKVKKYFILDPFIKFSKYLWKTNQDRKNKLSFKFIRNDGTNSSGKILAKLKILFSVQLPNIPNFYISKQILDKKQISITLIKLDKKKKNNRVMLFQNF